MKPATDGTSELIQMWMLRTIPVQMTDVFFEELREAVRQRDDSFFTTDVEMELIRLIRLGNEVMEENGLHHFGDELNAPEENDSAGLIGSHGAESTDTRYQPVIVPPTEAYTYVANRVLAGTRKIVTKFSLSTVSRRAIDSQSPASPVPVLNAPGFADPEVSLSFHPTFLKDINKNEGGVDWEGVFFASIATVVTSELEHIRSLKCYPVESGTCYRQTSMHNT